MKHGFCTDRLARIDQFLNDKYIGPGKLPGAQVQVLRAGTVVHETVIGRRDVERDLPLTRDTVYRIYSMTKPITSLVFMMLVEEGRVALDDPVTRFIPEWKQLGVYSAGTGPWVTTPCARPMQMVDLLRHTSGLTYGFQMRSNVDAAYRALKVADRDRSLDTARFVDELSRLPLEFSPGEAWNYSVSTDVLGVLIERITGQPFADVLQDRVFGPLGMQDTRFIVGEDQKARFAACYLPTPQGGMSLLDDPQTSPYLGAPVFYSGGGGLVSTADDYMRFCRMLLAGGRLDGHTYVAPATLRLMTANHLPGGKDLTALSRSLFSESTNAGVGFGLGFAVVFDPVRALVPSSPGEYYWGGAASTAFWVDPVEDIAVVFMTQLLGSSTYPVRRELRTLVYSALLEPRQRRG
jgi:CubicO group peptidase (beta-lactamase class C family)